MGQVSDVSEGVSVDVCVSKCFDWLLRKIRVIGACWVCVARAESALGKDKNILLDVSTRDYVVYSKRVPAKYLAFSLGSTFLSQSKNHYFRFELILKSLHRVSLSN
jgi:hypothetical protein